MTTILPSATHQAVREIKETVVGSSFMEFEEWVIRLTDQTIAHSVVFIQGSDHFVNLMREKLERWKEFAVVGIVPEDGDTSQAGSLLEKSWSSAKSVCVNHQQARGVTQGHWKVFSNLKLVGLKSSSVKRILRHILVAIESGMRLDEDHSTQLLVTADQRIPSRKHHVRVGVPSCFKKGDALVE